MSQETFWKIRCVTMWVFRGLAIVCSFSMTWMLVGVYQADPKGFEEAFQGGFAEIGMVAAGILIVVELCGRLFSWTHPYSVRLPRFRDCVFSRK